jgi:Tfp pilus assembly protein PilV
VERRGPLDVFRLAGVLRRLRREERGVTLMEMVVAMGIFATVTTPLAGVMTASMKSHLGSQERTLAEQAAAAQIESVRALPYDAVGVVNGNPPGSVVATRALAAPGIDATVATQISFVSDPTRTGYVTGADYKKVVVTVTNARGKRLTQAATYVGPPGRAPFGGVNGTIIRVQLLDVALNTAIAGASIALGTGPSAPRNDATDAAGTVVFAGLQSNPTTGAQAYYDVNATATGYTVLRDDLPPSSAAHVQLAPGQTFNTAIRVYRAATIRVALTDATGAAYTGAATVTVGSSRAAQSFAVSGGQLTVTSIGGEALVPGLNYTVAAYSADGRWAPSSARAVPDAYPNVLTSSFALALGAAAPATSVLTAKVQTATGAAAAGARVDLTGGPSQAYLSAITDATGTATFTIPSGSAYTLAATGANRSGVASWSGSVATATTVTARLA